MFNHLPPIILSTQVFGGRMSYDTEEGEGILLSRDCPHCYLCVSTLALVTHRLDQELLLSPI